MNFKNVAVVGANGFIGSHLTRKLLEVPNTTLFLFGRSKVSFFGTQLPYEQLDLNNSAQINESFKNIDIVYYLATESIPSSSWANPKSDIQNNLLPFINFMECIVALGVKKIVFLSSAGTIYGPTTKNVTEDSFKEPFSPHGITKLTMEYFLNYFRKKDGLNFDIYRVANVYGEGQNTGKGLGIINTFLEHILSDHKIQIFGDGEIVRNYIYVKDLADFLVTSLFADPNRSEIFNASSNDTMTINDLVAVIKEVVTEQFETKYTATRQSDNPAIYLDNTKILNANPGFKLTPIKEGIAKTYVHIKEHSAQ